MGGTRQIRRAGMAGGHGLGVDASGGPVIDPTENVLALVDAEKEHASDLRHAELNRLSQLRGADNKYQDAMRLAEVRRQDDLAAQKERSDKQIADILSIQVRTTSDLISTQLDKVTTALSSQIAALTATMGNQVTTLATNLGERLSELERFRYEMGGKTSVSDPATAEALREMSTAIHLLSGTDAKIEGRGLARGEIIAWVVGSSAAIVAVVEFFARHA
jgi:hypothetical protein